jgi:predicted nucleic acid-binding protein
MRPLLDTNVLVDVALKRPGLHEASGITVAWCLNNPGSGLLAVHSLATFCYLVGRVAGAAKARAFITDLTEGTDIVRLDNAEVKRALGLPMADFEDALGGPLPPKARRRPTLSPATPLISAGPP